MEIIFQKKQKREHSNSRFQTLLLRRPQFAVNEQPGGRSFSTVVKTCEPKRTYRRRAVLTSLTPSCPSEAQMSRENAGLCFLGRHASISRAKGTANLPRQQAPAIQTAAAQPVCVMPALFSFFFFYT